MTSERVFFVWERSFDSAGVYDRVLQSLSQGDLRVMRIESLKRCVEIRAIGGKDNNGDTSSRALAGAGSFIMFGIMGPKPISRWRKPRKGTHLVG